MPDTKDSTDRLDYFDFISMLAPGVVFLAAGKLFFPNPTEAEVALCANPAIAAIIFLAASFVIGTALHGFGDMLEFFFRGTSLTNASDRVFSKDAASDNVQGLGAHLPADDAKRIAGRLGLPVVSGQSISRKESQSTVRKALAMAEGSNDRKTIRFNALYHGHRAMFVCFVLLLALFAITHRVVHFQKLVEKDDHLDTWYPILLILLTALFLGLMRLRDIFFVRQILLTAERLAENQIDLPALRANVAKTILWTVRSEIAAKTSGSPPTHPQRGTFAISVPANPYNNSSDISRQSLPATGRPVVGPTGFNYDPSTGTFWLNSNTPGVGENAW